AEEIRRNTVAFALEGLDARIADVLSISGDVGFSRSLTLIKAVGNDVTARLEAGSSMYAEVGDATFGLILGEENGAARFALEVRSGTLGMDLGPVGEFSVREVFIQNTGLTTSVSAGDRITIGSVEYVFGTDISSATTAVFIDGKLLLGAEAGASLSIDGTFELTASETGFAMATDGWLEMGLLGGADVKGVMALSPDGLAAFYDLSQSITPDFGSVAGLGFSGDVGLEMNTSDSPLTVGSKEIDPGIRVRIDGGVEFVGFADASGTFDFVFGGSENEFAFDLAFEIGTLEVEADGTGVLKSDGVVISTPVGIEESVMGILGLDVSGNLKINTSSSSSEGISARSFRLDLSGKIDVAGNFDIKGGFTMVVVEGDWTAEIASTVDFYGIGDLDIAGEINSEAEFDFSVSGDSGIGVDGFGLFGDMDFSLGYADSNGTSLYGDQSYAVDFSGSGSLKVEMFGITLSRASMDVDYDSEDGGMSIEASVTIDLWLETITETETFDIGNFSVTPPPPVTLGSVSSGALTLNVGSRADQRGVREDDTSELIRIRVVDEPSSSSGQTVKISGFGRRQVFTNVTSIKGEFDEGTDAIAIDGVFTGSVELNMGGGSDVVMHYGPGDADIDMGAGLGYMRMPRADGVIVTGDGADIIALGEGTVTVKAGTVNSVRVGHDSISNITGNVYLNYGAFDGGFTGSVTRSAAELQSTVEGNSLRVEDSLVNRWKLGSGDDDISFDGLEDRTLHIVDQGSGS
ncbi:MAG: hypothetical protein HOC74_01540, partial [Gemmatimonadetes bacterium]|nr:hypothetical protein [Gemmatimonadota bacterium]